MEGKIVVDCFGGNRSNRRLQMISDGPGLRLTLLASVVMVCSCLGLLLVMQTRPHRTSASSVMDFAAGDGVLCSVHTRYIPSKFEQVWLDNVRNMAADYCSDVLADIGVLGRTSQTHGLQQWLTALKKDDEQAAPSVDHLDLDPSVFSRFITNTTCSQNAPGRKDASWHAHDGSETVTWIEPLAYGLRHPFANCFDSNVSVIDKSHLLVSHKQDLPFGSCRQRRCQSIFMDLGASTWDESTDYTSAQPWFVDAYSKRGIEFDRFLLWEAAAVSPPSKIFQNVPRELLHKYQYFNIPATPERTDPANPINMLKDIAQPGDFVVFKLDIDNTAVEMAIIQYLLEDAQARSMIDELFFEYQVTFPPMMQHWGQFVAPGKGIADAYDVFSKMRQMGIRAHPWV